MLRRVSYWNLAVALPILGSMAVLREPLLDLFGGGYGAGAAPLVLLVIGQLVLNAAGPLTAVINLSGHPRVTLFNNALVFAGNRVLFYVGVALVVWGWLGLRNADRRQLLTAIAVWAVPLVNAALSGSATVSTVLIAVAAPFSV